MRIYLKKRHVKKILVVIIVTLIFVFLLKLVSLWDAKRGSVDIASTTTPLTSENKPDDNAENTPQDTYEIIDANDNEFQNIAVDDTIKNEIKSEETQKKTDEIVDKYVSKLYSLQDEFEGRVSSLVEKARAWGYEYMEANPGVSSDDAKLACKDHFYGSAKAIEVECYARVDNLIELLRGELEAIGADTTVVSTVRSAAYSRMQSRMLSIIQ